MKKTIFFALLLFIGTVLIGAKSFTDIQPVDVDVGIENVDLIQIDAVAVDVIVIEIESCMTVQLKWPTLSSSELKEPVNKASALLEELQIVEQHYANYDAGSAMELTNNKDIPANIAYTGLPCLGPGDIQCLSWQT